MNQQHQLAAILFTDIVNFTALMQQNEQEAIRILTKHNEIIENCSKLYHGTVANNYGDGCLLVFNSATDAISCAIAVQHKLNKDEIVPVRMGLHLGEILLDGGNVVGDGVNIASRVQSLGTANSILLSASFYQNIKNHREFKCVSLGSYQFKNLQDPMEVYALSNTGLKIPRKSEMHGKLEFPERRFSNKVITALVVIILMVAGLGYLIVQYPFQVTTSTHSSKSLAVLPFDDMSTNHDQGFLSDGIAEEIINRLSKFDELKVVARTSSFSFRNKDQDIQSIGKKLNVSNILEGSVRKSESKIMITVRLTNSHSGFTIFSESYTDELENIFDLQSRIAIDVAEKIEARLSAKGKSLQNRNKINPLAYETFVKGKSQFINGPLNMVSGEIRVARKYFGSAVLLDSTFTEALAYLALTYFNLADWALPRSDIDGIKSALDSAKLLSIKAIKLDSLNSAAHLAMGSYYFHQYNWLEAEKEKRKAVQLNPGGTEEKFILASFLGQFGQAEEALQLDKEAMELDPLDLSGKLKYTRDLYRARKYDQCIDQCHAILKDRPNNSGAYQFLALSYAGKGQYEESRMAWYQNYKLIGDTTLANLYHQNDYVTAIKLLIEYMKENRPDPLYMAMFYAQIQDHENTFKYLNELIDKKLPQISFLSQDFFDFLREDPQYNDILKRAGLQEYYEFKDKQLNRISL